MILPLYFLELRKVSGCFVRNERAEELKRVKLLLKFSEQKQTRSRMFLVGNVQYLSVSFVRQSLLKNHLCLLHYANI
jgi:hypothetical protein